MTIPLLKHHVSPKYPWRETGVFDGWREKGLLPTISEVQKKVTPRLKKAVDSEGRPLYPFLTKDPKAKHMFELRWLECYKAYLTGDYELIPDFDPETGVANKDQLCDACPTWESRCQRLISVNKERF